MRGLSMLPLLALLGCQAVEQNPVPMKISKSIDWQGHRGARGLLPENTIPAFKKALEFPVKTLELDIAISKDEKVIVTHEPWFSEKICSKPDGQPVKEEEAKTLLIYQMTYEEIKTYDCGKRGNEKFPQQKAMATYKPSLKDMVQEVDAHAKELGRPLPHYNIEIKAYADYYGIATPEPIHYVSILLAELKSLRIQNRVILQSFDVNILEAIHQLKPTVPVSFLVDNMDDFETNMKKLSFQPDIYGPYFELITRFTVDSVHQMGMKLIPWTVNEVADMKNLIHLGVDGIITDYPNRIKEVK